MCVYMCVCVLECLCVYASLCDVCLSICLYVSEVCVCVSLCVYVCVPISIQFTYLFLSVESDSCLSVSEQKPSQHWIFFFTLLSYI